MPKLSDYHSTTAHASQETRPQQAEEVATTGRRSDAFNKAVSKLDRDYKRREIDNPGRPWYNSVEKLVEMPSSRKAGSLTDMESMSALMSKRNFYRLQAWSQKSTKMDLG